MSVYRRISEEDNTSGSVRPSVRLFPLYLLNQVTFDLELFACVWTSHDHSSPGIEGQGHRSSSEVKVWPVGHKVKAVLVHAALTTKLWSFVVTAV